MKTEKLRLIEKLFRPILLVCLLVFLVSGCMAPPLPPTPIEETPGAIMEKQIKSQKPPEPKDLAPIATIQPQMATEEEFPWESKDFSIQVVNEPMGNVLLALAQAANLNLILGKDVDRNEPVSVQINKLPLKTALDSLLSVHDYFYEIEGGILRIQGFKTAIYHIDYPLVYNNPTSKTGGDVLGGGSGGGSGSGGQSPGSGGTSGSIGSLAGSTLSGEFTIEVEVEDEDHLDIWKQVEEALKPGMQNRSGGALLSPDGKAQVNRMSGTVLVTDRPSRLELVERFIDRINTSLRRQVIIEAKIIEVILNKGHEWGINWSYIEKNFLHAGLFAVQQSLSAGANAFRVGFIDTKGNETGEVILDALATQGNVNILSSPRLNVLNNQSALISVGRIIPYLDFQIGSTVSRGVSGDIPIIDSVPVIARTLEGVTLGITPQVSADGVTKLHIVPIITEQTGTRTISIAQDSTTNPTPILLADGDNGDNGNDGTQNNTRSVDIPVFSIRETDTMVSVRDNETIVIGGLISENTKDATRKVPLLGDIPYLGALFTHQQRETTKNELVILLTTTVITQ